MPSARIKHPYYPIIYVRGYAGSDGEVEDTVADPYMGFNLGATKIRQSWIGKIERHFFESPLVRLMKDFEYRDVYSNGSFMPITAKLPERPIVIYRYYEPASASLGSGERGEIEEFADGLGELILDLRDRLCRNATARAKFRVYLVAHSMGGLICRCFLQKQGSAEATALVDKVYTYATPHNGIDLQVIENVPGFFTRNNIDNFNRKRMKQYLGLPGNHPPDNVTTLNGKFDPSRFFCLVGTNARDYTVASGLASKAVGPLSDGLVRIANATVQAAPRAFVHRSHSGHYGIVNSEGGYQNLIRFLFGDVRVDGVLHVKSISLPKEVEAKRKKGKKIRASYHFEVVGRVRGARWDLHRRLTGENSAIFRDYDELVGGHDARVRSPYLFSTFLRVAERVVTQRRSLEFAIDIGIQVPEYEIDNKLWLNDHYDGGYIFRDKLNLEAIPPVDRHDHWRLKYGFDSDGANQTGDEPLDGVLADGRYTFRIPIRRDTAPGIDAELAITTRPWNQ